jgi:hypothetical protein
MSTLAVNTITNAAGGNTAQINGMTPTADSLQGFRNRIINGDMRIDQRKAGAAVTVNGSVVTYSVDRFYGFDNSIAVYTLQQSSTAPAGFTNSLLATVTTASGTLTTTQRDIIVQAIEGYNIADLGWGAAGASPVTLSFWVRSSLTGSFGGALQNSASNRSYPFQYTISAADTWEQKTITIAGDTTGTWLTTNGIGVQVVWSLGVGPTLTGTANAWAAADYRNSTGSVNLVETLGATFYITGVQLEAGSVATPFERRPYGTELQLCSRYYQKSYNDSTTPGTATTVGAKWSGAFGANDLYYQSVAFNQSMRASATVRIFNVNNGNNNQLSEYTINPTTFVTNRAIAIKDAGQAGVSIDGNGQLANGRLYAYHFDATAEL